MKLSYIFLVESVVDLANYIHALSYLSISASSMRSNLTIDQILKNAANFLLIFDVSLIR